MYLRTLTVCICLYTVYTRHVFCDGPEGPCIAVTLNALSIYQRSAQQGAMQLGVAPFGIPCRYFPFFPSWVLCQDDFVPPSLSSVFSRATHEQRIKLNWWKIPNDILCLNGKSLMTFCFSATIRNFRQCLIMHDWTKPNKNPNQQKTKIYLHMGFYFSYCPNPFQWNFNCHKLPLNTLKKDLKIRLFLSISFSGLWFVHFK